MSQNPKNPDISVWRIAKIQEPNKLAEQIDKVGKSRPPIWGGGGGGWHKALVVGWGGGGGGGGKSLLYITDFQWLSLALALLNTLRLSTIALPWLITLIVHHCLRTCPERVEECPTQ